MDVIYFVSGLALGAVVSWMLAAKFMKQGGPEEETRREEEKKWRHLEMDWHTLKEKNAMYVRDLASHKEALKNMRQENVVLNSHIARKESDLENLGKKLLEQKQEVAQLQEKFTIQFRNLANDILEEKTKKFTDQNKVQLSEILTPLKEKIGDFEKKVEQTNKESIDRNAALKEQLLHLRDLNLQITREAENLTKALKGDSKLQGNWGEMQLEGILKHAGLEKNVHYFKEQNFKSEAQANQRPDYVIKLPDDKYLVLDSKVSLTAYADYFNASEEEKPEHLKKHLNSVRNHIKMLGNRNYQKLHDINQPDYVMMFVANEPALTLALREIPELYEEALDRNIVLVSTTTLLATLRTISYIWKQDLQNKNALEIARQAGALYDKFSNFTEDLKKVGQHLKSTHDSYDAAMNKLTSGKDNLVRKTERLKELGAKASKSLDQRLLDKS